MQASVFSICVSYALHFNVFEFYLNSTEDEAKFGFCFE